MLHKTYRSCLERMGFDEALDADHLSFSIWLTPRMMFLAGERTSKVVSPADPNVHVEINSLGFLGTLYAQDQASIDLIKAETPIHLLKTVTAKTN